MGEVGPIEAQVLLECDEIDRKLTLAVLTDNVVEIWDDSELPWVIRDHATRSV